MSEEDYNEDDYDVISDAPEYSRKSEFNKPKMVEAAFMKCIEARCKDMHPAYVNTSLSSDGTIRKEQIDDTRQAYVNSVKAAKAILQPEISRANGKSIADNKALPDRKSKIAELESKEKELFNKYCYEDRERFATQRPDGKWEIKRTGNKFIPENDQILGVDQVEPNVPGKIRGTVVRIKGYWNQQTNSYWEQMVLLHDEILGQLQHIVDDLNYFRQSSSF